MKTTGTCIVLLMLFCGIAEARYSSHSRGSTYGFATGHCKSSSCFSKHPRGSYVHPLTSRKHR